MFRGTLFADTVNHLTRKGESARTGLLIKRLGETLGRDRK